MNTFALNAIRLLRGRVLEHLSSQVFITYWDRYYLSIALYPLVAAWGLYSLLYYPHKSWWS